MAAAAAALGAGTATHGDSTRTMLRSVRTAKSNQRPLGPVFHQRSRATYGLAASASLVPYSA